MHLKRLNTPKKWNLSKKKTKFVAKPRPGPYAKEMSLPLIVVMRDQLGIVSTAKEAKSLLSGRKVLINAKPARDLNIGLGLFDTLSIPSANAYYRIVLDYKGGLMPITIMNRNQK